MEPGSETSEAVWAAIRSAPLWVSSCAALITFGAGVLPLAGQTATGKRLHFFLGMTAGLLLTTAFVSLIPEALQGDRSVGWTIAMGFLALYAAEWMVGVHGHGGGQGEEAMPEDTHFHRSAPSLPAVAFAALALHRAVDGLTLPAAFQVDQATGLTAGAAVLIHQFPDGFAAAVLFLAGGWSRRRTLAAVSALALFTPLGTLVGTVLVGVPGWVPHVVGLAAVTFIFIAVAELMPELHHGPHKQAVGIGLALGYVVAYGIERFGGS